MPRRAAHFRSFDDFFKSATGERPFPFQRRFAGDAPLPQLVDVATGLGKTAMAVVGWLWRRFGDDETRAAATPRRLVYCLPMRVLVEQTAANARKWIANLNHAACFVGDGPSVHVLMGGEDAKDWDIYPEREAILVGTQDMLLSRGLNRGYAASRSRWPIQFGLLHTDCLWVFDEIQLMGTGLATAAQLEAFRRLLPSGEPQQAEGGHGCQSVWMSATLRAEWLRTVDFAPQVGGLPSLALTDDDRKAIEKRWVAPKPVTKGAPGMGETSALAKEILDKHKPGTRTIAVLNTVRRARDLHDKITEQPGYRSEQRLVLLHSRFRPRDREEAVKQALADPPPDGTIVVSTQVIEAGVDVSATTLFTELAPWASLVQRFGRCNRRGEEDDSATVRWIGLPANDQAAAEIAAPYELDDLKAAAQQLAGQKDVGLQSLPEVDLPFEHSHVIRRKDLVDLFDTTPDLAGNDIDIDRFVREVEDSDVRVFWRAWDRPKGQEPPPEDGPAPRREELCPAPVGEFREFAKNKKHAGTVWRWSFLEQKWARAGADKIVPGQVFLVHAGAGGYSAERGWDPKSLGRVPPVDPPMGTKVDAPDAIEDERLSRIGIWQTVAKHTEGVRAELDGILEALPLTATQAEALRHAARWHDLGKAHEVFRAALPDGAPDAQVAWAKAAGKWKRYSRRHFRHELASALAVLLSPEGLIPPEHRDLVAYLVAAHHGKVRLSIRSLPNESRPDAGRRFARGVWDHDVLPATDLGGSVTAPAATLSLEPMELGLCDHGPFAGQPSWAERMIGLRDRLSPFRLAYLEAILRAADERASRAVEQREVERQNVKVPVGGEGAARG